MNKLNLDKLKNITDLVLRIFRINGDLINAGNELVNQVGLTSSKWQVLGALALNDKSMTVSQVAKEMGLSRQAVQRTSTQLIQNGLLSLQNNPYHKTSKILVLTANGKAVYAKAMKLYEPWVLDLVTEIPISNLTITLQTLTCLQEALFEKSVEKS